MLHLWSSSIVLGGGGRGSGCGGDGSDGGSRGGSGAGDGGGSCGGGKNNRKTALFLCHSPLRKHTIINKTSSNDRFMEILTPPLLRDYLALSF